MFLWCVQEVAELKEEDIISHTPTATQLPTAAAGVSGCLSRTLSELNHNNESVHVIMYSLQLLMTCVMCWRLWMISMTGRTSV